jgi:hypothetical protein
MSLHACSPADADDAACKQAKQAGRNSAPPSQKKLANTPSSGEKPPFRISSKSQSCLSLSTMAGRPSASAYSSLRRGKSRAIKSLSAPPVSPQCQPGSASDRATMPYHGVGSPLCEKGARVRGQSEKEVKRRRWQVNCSKEWRESVV